MYNGHFISIFHLNPALASIPQDTSLQLSLGIRLKSGPVQWSWDWEGSLCCRLCDNREGRGRGTGYDPKACLQEKQQNTQFPFPPRSPGSGVSSRLHSGSCADVRRFLIPLGSAGHVRATLIPAASDNLTGRGDFHNTDFLLKITFTHVFPIIKVTHSL